MNSTANDSDRIDPLHPAHDAGVLNRRATAIVAEWPAGTFLENLAPHADGRSWLVTSPSDRAVYRVGPHGAVEIAARFDGIPTGIARHPRLGTLAAAGTQGVPDWQLFRILPDGARPVADLTNVLSGNGMTWVGDRLFVVDSGRSRVVMVDAEDGRVTPWLEHELLTPAGPDSILPGVNGIAVHNDSILLTNSDRGLVLRTSTDLADPLARLEILAERLVGDDLAVADDGRVFVATHTYHSVLCLHPDGRREDVAAHDDRIAGPNAVAIGDGALFVTTTGGLLSPPDGEVESARLVRVDALRASR
ncbi:hypothetical protein A5784_18350 [Mycobacterium sp. 852013-50091_SCH5140682]|uniref:SMP-30/gluconolactonase/LRE family protein n=1 Tax=Mycobacterium sp. 852013-50091_SCH5140682 TaxID=1834109 RepID=UPI0007EAF246|nr:hypothetical protein [Mycobacterium sp. 852013-50091_SCH5140682]OBC01666.1 hypothetical protein A5784_18350 [Mycobacterium sp. 852013-50091_SCH5140682]